jgi:hypothetical protein
MKNNGNDRNLSIQSALRWAVVGALTLAAPVRAADTAKMDPAKSDTSKIDPKATTAKPDKNAIKASQAALQTAVTALLAETKAHLQSAKTPLREKSDYFSENKAPSLLPETIVQALGSTISPDVPSDSYIKWQLLSGAPAKFDDSLAKPAAAAYMKLGKIPLRPGITAADKRQLDPLVKEVKNSDDAVVVTKKLEDLVTPWEARNKPILAYRDELYARLPAIPEALVARLDDGVQRVEAGYPSEAYWQGTSEAITKWLDTNPPVPHLYVMAERVKGVINRGGAKPAQNTGGGTKGMGAAKYGNYPGYGATPGMVQYPPKFYEHVAFDSDKGVNKWRWYDENARQARAEVLSDLLVTIEDAAKTAKTTSTKEMTKK